MEQGLGLGLEYGLTLGLRSGLKYGREIEVGATVQVEVRVGSGKG